MVAINRAKFQSCALNITEYHLLKRVCVVRMGLEKKWYLNEDTYLDTDDVIGVTSTQIQFLFNIRIYQRIIFANNICTISKIQLEITNGLKCGYLSITTNLCLVLVVLFAAVCFNKTMIK